MIDLIIPTVSQGLLWALMALGVYITFRVLDIADLSVEGTFPLGAAVASTALTAGLGTVPAFLLAAVAGALAGIVTALLTTKLKIPALLAGILTMIGLYSVNLHVMGKANISLLRVDTVFSRAGLGRHRCRSDLHRGTGGRVARGRGDLLVLRHRARHRDPCDRF